MWIPFLASKSSDLLNLLVVEVARFPKNRNCEPRFLRNSSTSNSALQNSWVRGEVNLPLNEEFGNTACNRTRLFGISEQRCPIKCVLRVRYAASSGLRANSRNLGKTFSAVSVHRSDQMRCVLRGNGCILRDRFASTPTLRGTCAIEFKICADGLDIWANHIRGGVEVVRQEQKYTQYAI